MIESLFIQTLFENRPSPDEEKVRPVRTGSTDKTQTLDSAGSAAFHGSAAPSKIRTPKRRRASVEDDATRTIQARFPDKRPPSTQTEKVWDSFMDWIFGQQLQGIAYAEFKSRHAPEHALELLQKAYYRTVFENARKIQALEELDARLAKHGLFAIAIKGAALLDTAYPDLGLRPMEDLDLLVRHSDIPAIGKILENSGYEVEDAAFPHMFLKNGVLIDLHVHPIHADRFTGRKAILPFDAVSLRKDSLEWKSGCQALQRLDDKDHLILMAHHMVKHSFSKLIWLVDIREVLRQKDEAFRKQLQNRAASLAQQRPVAYALYLHDRIFGHGRSSGQNLAEARFSKFERAILDLTAEGHSIGDLGNLLWFFCINDFASRIRYLAGALLPESIAMQYSPGRVSCRKTREKAISVATEWLPRIVRNILILLKAAGISFRAWS